MHRRSPVGFGHGGRINVRWMRMPRVPARVTKALSCRRRL
jgi:hypothetical protein